MSDDDMRGVWLAFLFGSFLLALSFVALLWLFSR